MHQMFREKLGLEKSQFKFEEKKIYFKSLNHVIPSTSRPDPSTSHDKASSQSVSFSSVVRFFNVSFSLQCKQCFSVTTNENSVNSVNSVNGVEQ